VKESMVEIHRMHLIQTFNALQLQNHLKPFDEVYKVKEAIYLPPYKPGIKKTLIFDIDETMIHCLEDNTHVPDVIIKIPLDDNFEEFADAGINIRPHLYDCLRESNEHYQVIAFTASDQQYADAILDFLDPEREFFAMRLYR
jgi:CTD small phosphatase-like protein 2